MLFWGVLCFGVKSKKKQDVGLLHKLGKKLTHATKYNTATNDLAQHCQTCMGVHVHLKCTNMLCTKAHVPAPSSAHIFANTHTGAHLCGKLRTYDHVHKYQQARAQCADRSTCKSTCTHACTGIFTFTWTRGSPSYNYCSYC